MELLIFVLFCLTYFNDSWTHQVPSFTLLQVLFLSSCLFCFLILISAFFFTKLSSRILSHPLYYNSFFNIIASFISSNIHVYPIHFYTGFISYFSIFKSPFVCRRERYQSFWRSEGSSCSCPCYLQRCWCVSPWWPFECCRCPRWTGEFMEKKIERKTER